MSILQKIDVQLAECQALVLAPTRELAQQIVKVVRALGDFMQIKVCSRDVVCFPHVPGTARDFSFVFFSEGLNELTFSLAVCKRAVLPFTDERVHGCVFTMKLTLCETGFSDELLYCCLTTRPQTT